MVVSGLGLGLLPILLLQGACSSSPKAQAQPDAWGPGEDTAQSKGSDGPSDIASTPDTAVPIGDAAVQQPDAATPMADTAAPQADAATPMADTAAPQADVATPIADVAAQRPDVAAPTGDTAAMRTDVGGQSGDAAGAVSAKVGESLANYILATWPNLNTYTNKDWEYTNGIVLYGVTKIYEKSGKPEYLNYVKTFVDKYVNASGTISYATSGSPRDPRILDTIEPSNLLFDLYKNTNDARYLTAMTSTRKVFPTIQTNSLGGFFHKPSYPYEMWLDGLYMAEPFLVRYGSQVSTVVDSTGADQSDCYATATAQFKLLAQELMDRKNPTPSKRLPVHAWADLAGLSSAGKTAPLWANTTTGQSPTIWSRSLGWWALALVDVLQYLPQNHPDYQTLVGIFVDVAAGLKATQDPATGLWYQVTDQGAMTDNWLETSASALFVYALKRGVKQSILGSDYDAVASAGWEGVKKKVAIAGNTVTVQGAVGGMSVLSSYAAYVGAKSLVADNVPHGLAAVLFAASELEY
jgi:unsaturated rhamnogalacturonyl hydrolase